MKIAQALGMTASVLILAAFFTARTDGAGSVAGLADTPAPPVLVSATAEPRSQAGETVLKRQGDGHFYADVTVNGRPLNMLVDTGASFIALTAADADALGLSWSETDAIVIGEGASGPVMGVPLRLDTVEVGDHRASGVEGAIIPEGLGVSLLGQSFLAQIDNVAIRDDEMVLGAQ